MSYGILQIGIMLAALPAIAHHRFDADYDSNKTVTLNGTVDIDRSVWANPHVRLYFDVRNGQGEVEHWEVEFGSADDLIRRGLRFVDLRDRGKVSIEGWMAKKGRFRAMGRTIVLPDGRRVVTMP